MLLGRRRAAAGVAETKACCDQDLNASPKSHDRFFRLPRLTAFRLRTPRKMRLSRPACNIQEILKVQKEA